MLLRSFGFVSLTGVKFQLSKVDFGSTKIGEDLGRRSGGVNDRRRLIVCHVSTFA